MSVMETEKKAEAWDFFAPALARLQTTVAAYGPPWASAGLPVADCARRIIAGLEDENRRLRLALLEFARGRQ